MFNDYANDLPFSDEPFDEEQAKAQEKWLEENHDRILENQRENYDELMRCRYAKR